MHESTEASECWNSGTQLESGLVGHSQLPQSWVGWELWDHCHEMPQEQALKGEQLGPGVSVSPSPVFVVPEGGCANTMGLRELSMVAADPGVDQSPRHGHCPGQLCPHRPRCHPCWGCCPGWEHQGTQRCQGMGAGSRPRCGMDGTTATAHGVGVSPHSPRFCTLTSIKADTSLEVSGDLCFVFFIPLSAEMIYLAGCSADTAPKAAAHFKGAVEAATN